eukprot:2707353-Pyramimonas_sp.AAC.1
MPSARARRRPLRPVARLAAVARAIMGRRRAARRPRAGNIPVPLPRQGGKWRGGNSPQLSAAAHM